MSNQPNIMFNPVKLANTGDSMSGQLALAQLSALKNELAKSAGVVHYVLKGGIDSGGRRYIETEIKATVELTCQRCTLAFDYQVSANSVLCPVMTIEQARELPSMYEPLLLKEVTVSIASILAEELLLNLPMVPKHQQGQCPTELSQHLN